LGSLANKDEERGERREKRSKDEERGREEKRGTQMENVGEERVEVQR
jgi:hypothetical protein